MKRRTLILLAPALLALAAGLTVTMLVAFGGKGGADEAPREFPEFVYHSAATEAAYKHAVDQQGLFTQVNCYCGCVNLADDPHRNLLDCFMNEDGTFDQHAVGCSVCVDIAGDAVAWQAKGNSADEIARMVDAKYGSVGPSTRP